MTPITNVIPPRKRLATVLTALLLPAAGAVMAAGPAVTGVQPLDGSTGVKRASTVVATFDQTLSSQISNTSLTLVCDGMGVAGTLSVTGNQLQLTPLAPLPSGRNCTASVAAEGVRNPDGQVNAGATSWSFRTIVKNKTLTVTRAGTGTGAVIGGGNLPPPSGRLGIDCGAKCDARVLEGNRFVLEAKPAVGSSFARWVGCPQPDGDRCIIPSMDRDRQVSARFQISPLPAEVSFRTVQTPINSALYALAYGKGILVASGQGKQGPLPMEQDIKGYYTLMYSTDMGETWQQTAPLQPLNTSVNPRDSQLAWLNFNGEQFLTFDWNYKDPFVSSDGINWTRGQRPNLGSETVAAVAWCKNRYLALTRKNVYATSTDGLNWTTHDDSPLGNAGQRMSTSCLPNGDLLVTSRYVRTADTPAIWKLQADSHVWAAVESLRTRSRPFTYAPGSNLYVGFDTLAASPMGRIVANPFPDGEIFKAPAFLVADSADLGTWFRQNLSPESGIPSRVAWTGAGFEALRHDGQIMRSRNGYTWTPMQPTGVTLADFAGEGDIPFAWAGNRLVVVGQGGMVAIGTP